MDSNCPNCVVAARGICSTHNCECFFDKLTEVLDNDTFLDWWKLTNFVSLMVVKTACQTFSSKEIQMS